MSISKLESQARGKIMQYAMIGITFISYIVCWIFLRVSFVKILPLFVSLFVVMLQAKVNRFGYLLGGLNSILYAIIYISAGVYASAASALLFSLPMQIVTFLRWQKHAYKESTVLRRMSRKGRMLCAGAFLFVWGITLTTLTLLGSEFAFLDTSVSLLGVLVSILTMLAFVEYAPLWLVSNALSLVLNLQLTLSDISFFPYAIAGVYNLICTIISVFNVAKLYKLQNTSEEQAKAYQTKEQTYEKDR